MLQGLLISTIAQTNTPTRVFPKRTEGEVSQLISSKHPVKAVIVELLQPPISSRVQQHVWHDYNLTSAVFRKSGQVWWTNQEQNKGTKSLQVYTVHVELIVKIRFGHYGSSSRRPDEKEVEIRTHTALWLQMSNTHNVILFVIWFWKHQSTPRI